MVALAALLRLAATWNDLWLDEIWTLTLITGLRAPLEIVTALHHDNNHVLNTFFLYLLRPLGSEWLYRVPALVAGIATVVLGAYLAGLDDPPGQAADDARPQVRALVAAIVLGVSHPLVQYASEARGYALALAFGLGAMVVAVRARVRPWSRTAPWCWALLVLALLSHALALHLLVGLVGWGTVRTLGRDGVAKGIATLAWWFAVPVLAFTAFYLGFLRGITVGGGNREGILPPLARAAAVVSGLPVDLPLALALALVLAIATGGLRVMARRGSDLWVLFVVGMVVSPAALAVTQPTDLYAERYFLVSMLLWLLCLARLVAWLGARGGAATGAAVAMLVLFAVANGRASATCCARDAAATSRPSAAWSPTRPAARPRSRATTTSATVWSSSTSARACRSRCATFHGPSRAPPSGTSRTEARAPRRRRAG